MAQSETAWLSQRKEMKMEPKTPTTSPRPWRTDELDEVCFNVLSSGDIALIVKAVNAHDALVELAKKLVEFDDAVVSKYEDSIPQIIAMARAALGLVEPPEKTLTEQQKQVTAAESAGLAWWVENGVIKTGPKLSPEEFGPHDYTKEKYGIGSCRCGCSMGGSSSYGPVNPFGPCPMNPLSAAPKLVEGEK